MWRRRVPGAPGATAGEALIPAETSSTSPDVAAAARPGQMAGPAPGTAPRMAPATSPPPVGPAVPNGPVAAAILAAGIGCFVLGLTVVLAEASPAISNALTFSTAVGALSGKTTVAIGVWLVSWLVLHLAWRRRQVGFALVYAITLVLIVLGLLGTFPPFFDLFAH